MAAAEDRKQLFDAWHALFDPLGDFDGTVRLPMLSGSMAPLIPVGAQMEIASARQRAFGVGDVVVFARDGRLVAHQLVFALGFGRHVLYLERGDRNEAAGIVRRRDVCGVVTGWRPDGGGDEEFVAVTRSRGRALRSLLEGSRVGLRSRLRRLAARLRGDPGN